METIKKASNRLKAEGNEARQTSKPLERPLSPDEIRRFIETVEYCKAGGVIRHEMRYTADKSLQDAVAQMRGIVAEADKAGRRLVKAIDDKVDEAVQRIRKANGEDAPILLRWNPSLFPKFEDGGWIYWLFSSMTLTGLMMAISRLFG